jgi:hypothetical protein
MIEVAHGGPSVLTDIDLHLLEGSCFNFY